MSIEQHGSAPAEEAPPRTPLSLVKGDTPPRAEVDTTAPILPLWLRDRLTFTTTLRNWARRNAYRSGKWGLHLPAMLAYLVWRSPWGLAQIVARLAVWVYDQDSAELRHQHAGNKESGEYARVHAVRRANLHARMLVFGTAAAVLVGPVLAWTFPYVLSGIVGAVVTFWTIKVIPGRDPWEIVAAVAAGAATWWFLPEALALLPRPPAWAAWAAGVLAVLVLGWIGRPQGKKLVKDTDFAAAGIVEKPTAEMVIDALCRIGVPGMTLNATDRVKEEIRLRAPGVARSARGYTLELELPPGITAAAVMDKREGLAGALRRKLGTVWPSKGPDHPGHLRLFLSDVPMATAPQAVWPVAKRGEPIDIFEAFPLFTDKEGEWVDVTVMGTHLVIAGASGFGKSVCLRQLACAVAFDPRVRPYVFDGKISGDLDPIRKVAHAYYEGAEPEDVAEQLTALKTLESEMRRRSRFLRDLPPEERSPKVTSALASKYRHLSPIVVLIDECQEYTEYGTKGNREEMKLREEFRSILTRISRLGRSAAIAVVFVSQKPDADVLPTAIMGNCAVRICFKVTEQGHNDQVLGTGAYKAGLKATLFSQEDRGLAWLKAAGDPQVVRSWSAMVELEPAVKLVEKAYQLRVARGLLTGQAAGELEVPAEPEGDLLDDVYEVMRENQCRNTSLDYLRDKLGLLRPGIWGHLDNEALGGMLRQARVVPAPIHCPVEGRSMRGIKVDWVTDAIDLRDGPDLTEGGENLTAG